MIQTEKESLSLCLQASSSALPNVFYPGGFESYSYGHMTDISNPVEADVFAYDPIGKKTIRDDAGGHSYPDNPSQNRPTL